MKINPYKLGLNIYIILVVSVFIFIGCRSLEKREERNAMRQAAEDILNTPDLTIR